MIHEEDGGESVLQHLQANYEQVLRHVQTITHATITTLRQNCVVHVDSPLTADPVAIAHSYYEYRTVIK